MQPFVPIAPLSCTCKCCDATATLYGVVDFNKNCEALHGRFPLPPAGIPVYYHRCAACGLIFTTAFDDFTKADFAAHVYNDTYALVDPDYADIRPRQNAQMLTQTFGATPAIRILDYGGGNGGLTRLLRAAGFTAAETYDPFVAASEALPTGRFALILSFEVVEHSPTPKATFDEMVSLLADDGVILFSTLAQPPDIDRLGLNWWYAGPRNGHVTLYSMAALHRIAGRLGMRIASAGTGVHMLYRTVPAFARHVIT